ncbi:MAG: DinB family protein [Sediminicola sp.]|tara:strand:- start:17630 stop:18103 length:474 start_codon:yes stop_codon:yes gene_type:complete
MLYKRIEANFGELIELLEQLSTEQYASACKILGNSSIGGHYRHIIEMYACLVDNYESGNIDYDARQRNKLLETSKEEAVAHIRNLMKNLEKENKTMVLQHSGGLETNYHRELLYNLEHSIHHQALIKIGVAHLCDVTLSPNFGVAPSTQTYRSECAR